MAKKKRKAVPRTPKGQGRTAAIGLVMDTATGAVELSKWFESRGTTLRVEFCTLMHLMKTLLELYPDMELDYIGELVTTYIRKADAMPTPKLTLVVKP